MLWVVLSSWLGWQLEPAVKAQVIGALRNLDRFEADFEQETYSDFFDETVATGVIKVDRPGKMRMEYRKGERKVFIWDGQTCYERDFMADTETRAPQEDVKQEPMVQILLYGSDVDRLFLIDRRQQGGQDIFRLRPRNGDSYQVEVMFDPSWLPVYLEVFGEDGDGTRIWLKNHRLDPVFSEDVFTPPPAGEENR